MTAKPSAQLRLGTLGEIADVLMGQSPVGSSYNRDCHGAPLINGPTEFTDRHPIPKQWTTAPVRFCKPNDVLICVRGSSTGRMNVADISYCIGRGVAAVRAAGKNDQAFVMYSLAAVVDELLKLQSGSTFPSIDSRVIRGGTILIPNPAEQKQIGWALVDADDLIASLERLIAKKQSIKQGVMQQLLTGGTRLPGFSKPWHGVRLRDAGTTYGGLSGKTKDDFGRGSASFVTFMEVIEAPRLAGRRLARVRVRPAEHQNRVERGDVLFNGSSETPEEVALAAAVDFDPSAATYLNSFCFGYRIKRRDQIDPTYLAYFFRSGTGRTLVSALAQGATRYNIAKTKLLEVSPVLPPLAEQQAIVNVLGDAEDEIAGLQLRLRKARDVKQGMMQQLLTGRTRLPDTEAAS